MMDLKKVKSIIFKDIELALSNLDMSYEILGDNIYSTCPIHEGSDNCRAFSLSKDKRIWTCWTRGCQEDHGNDIFGLIQGVLSQSTGEPVGFKEALLWVCKVLNIDSYDIKVEKVEEPDDFVKLVNIFRNNTSHQNNKLSEPTSVRYNVIHPSPYFQTRGFSESTLLHFEVGDCADKSSSMHNRSLIPIHSDDGSEIVAHIGRSTKHYMKPKFLFTKGFDKRMFLYNYHRAIDIATSTSCLFVTEGQGDVWRLYEAGVNNAVSIFGKTLTEQQVAKLTSSEVTTLVVLTDNDQAGREAKTDIQRRLGRMFNLVFPRMTSKDIGDMPVELIKSKVLTQVGGNLYG